MRKTSAKCCLTSRVLTLAATKNLNNGFLIHYHVHFPYEDILWCSTQSLAAKHHNLTGSLAHLPKYHLVDLLRGNPSAGEQLLYHPRSKLWYNLSLDAKFLHIYKQHDKSLSSFGLWQTKISTSCAWRGARAPLKHPMGVLRAPTIATSCTIVSLKPPDPVQARWTRSLVVWNQVGRPGLSRAVVTVPHLCCRLCRTMLADGTQLSGGRWE